MTFLHCDVETEGTRQDWLDYLHVNSFEGWTPVYNARADDLIKLKNGEQSVLQPYNVWYYPSFFLLDQDKNLMAKKLSYPQIEDFINTVLQEK